MQAQEELSVNEAQTELGKGTVMPQSCYSEDFEPIPLKSLHFFNTKITPGWFRTDGMGKKKKDCSNIW